METQRPILGVVLDFCGRVGHRLHTQVDADRPVLGAAAAAALGAVVVRVHGADNVLCGLSHMWVRGASALGSGEKSDVDK